MKTYIVLLSILLTPPLTAHQQVSFGMKDVVDSSTRVVKTAAYAGAAVFFTGIASLFGFTAVTALPDIWKMRGSSRMKFPSEDRIVHYPIFDIQHAFSDSFFTVVALTAAIYSVQKAKEAATQNKKES
jgi:hypothetical protein